MAISAIAGAAASLPTIPTLPATGKIGWIGEIGAAGTTAGAGTVAAGAAGAVSGTQSFGQTLVKALDGLQGAQTKADGLAVQAATGDLTNVHDYMIAATEASLATELTVAVRNKAVEAFNQIMNMAV
ncbi:MAG TPA: flagellar hook-basal body complex protein FliE [Acidimicrobiia bacterium]|jgi:flagellar hook-basal body complex protein FliE|nr:flagellar hook-basal body complex protein FliE [Acidimicrobiia bacterium]